uniref:Uncharacterized protein n=1 Tax=Rhizophora mucronata TaxID=61149 RepID=A0A2P2Q289_RHIMU
MPTPSMIFYTCLGKWNHHWIRPSGFLERSKSKSKILGFLLCT